MKRSDVIFNKNCMAVAFLELLNEKDFKLITISEIAKKAGVSRMVDYRNYTCKEDILADHLTYLIEEYKKSRVTEDDKKYDRILNAINFFKNAKDFIIIIEKSNLSMIIQDKINEYMKSFYPEINFYSIDKYKLYIFSGAIYNVARTWILSGLKESPEEIANIFVRTIYDKTVLDK